MLEDTFDIIEEVKKCATEQECIMLFRMITEMRYKNLTAKNKA
jgi:hypothetical protein